MRVAAWCNESPRRVPRPGPLPRGEGFFRGHIRLLLSLVPGARVKGGWLEATGGAGLAVHFRRDVTLLIEVREVGGDADGVAVALALERGLRQAAAGGPRGAGEIRRAAFVVRRAESGADCICAAAAEVDVDGPGQETFEAASWNARIEK